MDKKPLWKELWNIGPRRSARMVASTGVCSLTAHCSASRRSKRVRGTYGGPGQSMCSMTSHLPNGYIKHVYWAYTPAGSFVWLGGSAHLPGQSLYAQHLRAEVCAS